MQTSKVLKKKICLIGSFGVGKTSLIRRFVYDEFDDKYLSTIGVKVSKKILAPHEGVNSKLYQLELLIWDIEGHEKNLPVIEEYFAGSTGAIAVADVSREDTIEQLDRILKEYLKVASESKIVIVGNKIDLDLDKTDIKKSISQYADGLNINTFFTSAKTGEMVEETFTHLGEMIVKSL